MTLLYITLALCLVSFLFDRKKTLAGIKKGVKKFLRVLPVFLIMIIITSLVLTLLPREVISRYLSGENRFLAALAGLACGSVALLPGFIAFPLGGMLREQGVPYFVIAAFTSSLMMVGVLTFPVEKTFFGTRFALLRNLAGVVIAAAVALVAGLFFGEILP